LREAGGVEELMRYALERLRTGIEPDGGRRPDAAKRSRQSRALA
jgi:hypothetical protein